MKTALTIAGADPCGGAGIQADLKVFSHYGIYGLSVIAALTAQNSREVRALTPVSRAFTRLQLDALLSDMTPDAVKTGMLYSAENVEAVAAAIKKYRLAHVVIDPVFVSSSGKSLSEKKMPDMLRSRLLPLSTVITPNMHEASVLSGIEVKNMQDMKRAAELLHDMGAKNVIVTGGHLGGVAADVFYDGSFAILKCKKVPGEYHGTGCRFSAALTALLALGSGVREAADLAKEFIRMSLGRTLNTGKGMDLFV